MRWRRKFILCVIALILTNIVLALSFVHLAQAANMKQSMSAKSVQSSLLNLDQHASNHTSTFKSFVKYAGANVFTLRATEIDGVNARLVKNTDLTHPTLTFTASTITGFQLSYPLEGATMTISSGGQTTTTGSGITTSLLDFLLTAKSFVHPADLGALVVGKTVSNLQLKNVTLTVDTSIQVDNLNMPQFQLVLS